MQLKTPGVYVKDLTPPRPIVPVIETALPAFIGYTERVQNELGEDLRFKPVRIEDITEYEFFFGGRFDPREYTVGVQFEPEKIVETITFDKRFYLYDALLQFYENGGGDCFIVPVGSYDDNVILGREAGDPDETKPAGLLLGVEAIADLDEPSLILFPDAVALSDANGNADFVSQGRLLQVAMAQAEARKDRFVLGDVFAQGDIRSDAQNFRNSTGTRYLNFGAAYYPWLYSTFDHTFHFRELLFNEVQDGVVVRRIEDMGEFSSDSDSEGAARHRDLVSTVETRMAHAQQVLDNGVPDILDRKHTSQWRLRMVTLARAFKQSNDGNKEDRFAGLMTLVRSLALAFPRLDRTVGLELQQTLDRIRFERGLRETLSLLLAIERLPEVRMLNDPPWLDEDVDDAYTDLINTRWLSPLVITASSTTYVEKLEEVALDLIDAYTILFFGCKYTRRNGRATVIR